MFSFSKLVEGWKNVLWPNVFVQTVAEFRLQKCSGCEHLTKLKACGKCKCPVMSKTRSMSSSCPVSIWPMLSPELFYEGFNKLAPDAWKEKVKGFVAQWERIEAKQGSEVLKSGDKDKHYWCTVYAAMLWCSVNPNSYVQQLPRFKLPWLKRKQKVATMHNVMLNGQLWLKQNRK